MAAFFDRAACVPASRTPMKNYKIAAALIGSFVLGAGVTSVLYAQGHAPTYDGGQDVVGGTGVIEGGS